MSQSNGFASRDELLSAVKRRFKTVELPGGMKVRIRSLTEGEYADWDIKNYDPKTARYTSAGLRKSDTRLIVACVCDGEGNPLFMDADHQQIEAIDAAVTRALLREIRGHLGLTSVEDSIKNSETTSGGGSPITSSSGQGQPQSTG